MVLASPAVLFGVLRLRAMAPVQQQDPSMHSTFIFDPEGLFSRFGSSLSPEIMGDSARVGFLVPARVFYLLFGAVPGFFVYRYVLALIAVVPVYLLLRRLYGRWGGLVGIVVVMSSPVVVATWGSDYASAAAISYLTGGLAALALSWEERRWGKLWLLSAGALFTLAVWTNGISVLLIAAALVAYLGVRLVKDRRQLGWDVLALGTVAVLTTVVLALCSKALLGWWDFIEVSIRSARDLNTPLQVRLFHSTSWAWAPYDLYLLVPPAVLISYFAIFARRTRMRSSVIFVGIAGGLQLLLFAYLQFFGRLWVLEMPLFSCLLWSSTNLMLALVVSESMTVFTGPVLAESGRDDGKASHVGSPLVRLVALSAPALLVLAVPLAYEAAPRPPALTWAPWGYVLALIIIAAAGIGRLTLDWRKPARHGQIHGRRGWMTSMAGSAVVIITGATLILTVAPEAPHATPGNTSPYNPRAEYSSVLGGGYAKYLEEYRVTSELPAFVGKPAYRGEELIMWSERSEWWELLGPLGIYDSVNFLLSGSFPSLDAIDNSEVEAHHPGQILLISPDGKGFDQAVQSLSPFAPVVVRRTVLGNETYQVHVWLIDLARYDSPPRQ